MSEKAILRTVAAIAIIVVFLIGAAIWYYAFGRKPSVVVSKTLPQEAGEPVCRRVGNGDVLLVSGNSATLIDTKSGHERWTIGLANAPAPAPSTPPVVTRATPVPVPPPALAAPVSRDVKPQVGQGRNHDEELAEARLKKEFDRLRKWSEALNFKRNTLKTELQTKAFNEEAAKYHAELAAAQAESVRIAKLRAQASVPAPKAEPANEFKLIPPSEAESVEEDGFASQRISIVGGSDHLWLIRNQSALNLDRDSGRILKLVALPDRSQQVLRGSNAFFVVTSGAGGRHVTRISASDGAAVSIVVPLRTASELFTQDGKPVIEEQRSDFAASGDSLLEMDAAVVERKVTERQAMKESGTDEWEKWDQSSKSGFGDDALKMGKLIANDAMRSRTGGKAYMDDSTYRVTISHPLGGAGGNWTDNVHGRPEIFSSATLDFLAAGTQLIAFDRTGKKLWAANLGQPISPAAPSISEEPAAAPCIDAGGSICIYDRAFLTAFERGSGKVIWRLPSVGIRKVQADAEGMLYVCSDNASAESLRYSQDARLREGQTCVLMKVDPANGKVLWSVPKYEDCFVAENGVYATRFANNAQDGIDRVFDSSKVPECRFLLFKLSARDGSPQWQWLQFHHPLSIDAEGRKVSILFRNEFQSLKSLAW